MEAKQRKIYVPENVFQGLSRVSAMKQFVLGRPVKNWEVIADLLNELKKDNCKPTWFRKVELTKRLQFK